MTAETVPPLDHLDRNGYAVVAKLVEPQLVHDVVEAIETGGAELRRRGSGFGRRNVLEIPAIAEVAAGTAVREVVEEVLGPMARVVRGLFFDKTPEANWTVPWHQDRSIAVRERLDVAGYGPWSRKAGVVHVQPPVEVLRSMLTVRIHLDDCGEKNGPLRVIPRTHEALLNAGEVDAAVAAGPQKVLTCPSGGAVVMRPLLLHASSPATSPRHRRVLHLEYAATDLAAGLAWQVR